MNFIIKACDKRREIYFSIKMDYKTLIIDSKGSKLSSLIQNKEESTSCGLGKAI